MSDSIKNTKPTIYQGMRIPFGDLSPESFEDFAYGVLYEVAPKLGLRITGAPGGTGDRGFDIEGVRLSDGERVCLQCKRYTDTPLSKPHVAVELAKVALNTKLKGSTIVEHYIISSGDVRPVLRDALRETDHSSLIAEAVEKVLNDDSFEALRSQAQEAGIDVSATVTEYIQALGNNIIVWDGREFDIHLSSVYPQIQTLVDKYFQVEHVLRDQPRPDFDEGAYLNRCSTFSPAARIPLMVRRGEIPANLRTDSPADPLYLPSMTMATPGPAAAAVGDNLDDAVPLLCDVQPGELVLLIGSGGAGKTTTLEQVNQRLGNARRSSDAQLPIQLNLSEFRDDLDAMIKRVLGITWGHWTSIPGRFLLLCDGLNEVPPGLIFHFLTQLGALPQARVGCVVSLRSSGLARPVKCRPPTQILELVPLSIAQIRVLASRYLEHSDLVRFIDIVRERLDASDVSLLSLPFGIACAIRVFRRTGSLPSTRSKLVEEVFYDRFERNHVTPNPLPDPLADVEYPTLKTLAQTLAYHLRILRRRSAISREELDRLVMDVCNDLRDRKGDEAVFGISDLKENDLLRLIQHYEVLTSKPGGWWRMEHDIVAGFLAAPLLARTWRQHLDVLRESQCDDAWLFAGAHLSVEELHEYLAAVATVDLRLAAWTALEAAPEGLLRMESLIEAVEAQEGIVAQAESALSWAIIRTPHALKRLHARLDPEGHFAPSSSWAARALAMAGDEAYLSQILPTADRMMGFPGTISGREVDLWEHAPTAVALSLARQRLEREPPTSPLTMSLLTIVRYGDESDVHFIEGVMDGCSNFTGFTRAVHFLNRMAPDRAVEKLRHVLDEVDQPLGKFDVFRLLHEIGQPVDLTWLLAFAMGDFWNQTVVDALTEDRYRADMSEAIKILHTTPLPRPVQVELMQRYEGADADARRTIWLLAAAHGLPDFDSVAWDVINRRVLEEFGHVARFANSRSWTAEEFTGFTVNVTNALLLNTELWYSGDDLLLLDYLLERRQFETVTVVIQKQLSALLDADRRCHSGEVTVLMAGAEDILSESRPGAVQYRIADLIASRVCRSEQISDRLPVDLRVSLLQINMSGREGTWSALRALLSSIGDAAIDHQLEQIADRNTRLWALSIVSCRGATPTRLRILREELIAHVSGGWSSKELALVMTELWGDEALSAVVEGLVNVTWNPEVGPQFLIDLMNRIAERITPELAQRFLAPALAGQLSPSSREILQWWNDIAPKNQRRPS